MFNLKPIDLKILFALMKNSKISDRKLASEIGVSQPTVTRRRARLEREVIDGYTAIPKWDKLGYEILAITLVKTKPVMSSRERYPDALERGIDWLKNQNNIIMGGAIEGMGMTSFVISLHKSYPEYDNLIVKLRREMGHAIDDAQHLLVNLTATERLKPLHLKYLAESE